MNAVPAARVVMNDLSPEFSRPDFELIRRRSVNQFTGQPRTKIAGQNLVETVSKVGRLWPTGSNRRVELERWPKARDCGFVGCKIAYSSRVGVLSRCITPFRILSFIELIENQQ